MKDTIPDGDLAVNAATFGRSLRAENLAARRTQKTYIQAAIQSLRRSAYLRGTEEASRFPTLLARGTSRGATSSEEETALPLHCYVGDPR